MQFNFFKADEDKYKNLAGFKYLDEFIDREYEDRLVEHIRELPFREFDFHGYKGKRRIVSFGWQYEYSGAGALLKADAIPSFLRGLQELAASFAGLNDFQQALVTEYGPGAGIGWHRDKPVFGRVAGISLLAPCVLRFRKQITKGGKWERVNVFAEPRSAYVLSGAARSEWQHSILRVDSLRYSITFREVLTNRTTRIEELEPNK
ncbi:MAG TPA: alpha-ketoglutarate-dependent dioxygenase AlkB [Pyrinomonadaceae bacterium]